MGKLCILKRDEGFETEMPYPDLILNFVCLKLIGSIGWIKAKRGRPFRISDHKLSVPINQ